MKAAMLPKLGSEFEPDEFERISCASHHLNKWRREVPTGVYVPSISNRFTNFDLLSGLCGYWTSIGDDDVAVFYEHTGKVRVVFALDARTCFRIFEEQPIKRAKTRKHLEVITRLEKVAKEANEATFLSALKEVNWSERSASEYVRTIDLALEAGAHVAARELSAKGAEQHPENAELQKRAYILSPPKVTRGATTTGSAHRANRDWLKAHADEYHGQWVAVRDGELLDAAGSMEELVERIGNTKGILLTVV
jgi:hypothetical protein